MSFKVADLHALADKGFAIVEETNNKVTDMFVTFHDEHCENLEQKFEECRSDFMEAMFLLMDQRAQMARAVQSELVTVLEVHIGPEAVDPKLN